LFGFTLAVPLFPLYYVRTVEAPDSWIGFINTSQTAVLLIGYFMWTRFSKVRGSRFVLLWTTFGLALYPALIASTTQLPVIVALAGIAGIFQAGIDLVFFDELMKTVPIEYSATFVSFAQGVQYSAALIAPLLGTFLADQFGIETALMFSAAVRFIGFLLFALGKKKYESADPGS
jgi:MFS family permease